MNMENIASLMSMLKGMGVGAGPMRNLLQHACLHAKSFAIKQSFVKGKDILNCTITFEEQGGVYACPHYDASLLKDINFPEKTINGVNIAELDKRMLQVDWAFVGSTNVADAVELDKPETWAIEAAVGKIVDEVLLLAGNEETKVLADGLKLKHWGQLQTALLPVGNLPTARARYETTQRFYVVDGESIPLDDAWRFLNNKWMERKVQESRKVNTAGSTKKVVVPAKKPNRKTGQSNR